VAERKHTMKFRNDREIPNGAGCCACCGGIASTLWMTVPRPPQENKPDYRLLQCPACTHVWLADPPAPNELAEYYGPAYHQAISGSGDNDTVRWGSQLDVIKRFKSGGAVLDIGCSSGGFLASLKNGPWTLAGIEASEETAAKARAATGGNIFEGDVMDAVFPPASFDVITCSDVMEHLYEPRAVFERVMGWLKPGGIFYVFVPNIQSWEARAFRTYWFGLDLPRHLHHYSVQSLSALGRSAGLRQVHMATPRGSYLEQSTSLWLNDVSRRAGAPNLKWNLSGPARLPWKVARKAMRLTAESLYAGIAASCSAGPSVQAVFQKEPRPELVTSGARPEDEMPQRVGQSQDQQPVAF
jgi:SAM-dependent methyltransferase